MCQIFDIWHIYHTCCGCSYMDIFYVGLDEEFVL